MDTVIHEMLYFIFYEYIRDKYLPREIKKLNESKIRTELENKFVLPIWDLSEIINVILMNEKDFKLIVSKVSNPYEGHKKDYKKLIKVWREKGEDINLFMEALES